MAEAEAQKYAAEQEAAGIKAKYDAEAAGIEAKGLAEAEIASMLCRSAKQQALPFNRQDVYNFCVKLDGSDRMLAAAQRVLDDNWLPSHSEPYREAYHPAYRVLHKDFLSLLQETGD